MKTSLMKMKLVLSLLAVTLGLASVTDACGDLGGVCVNNGVCEDDGFKNYECTCQPGWDGTFCENMWCGSLGGSCQNNGICQPDSSSGDMECFCDPFFDGDLCQNAVCGDLGGSCRNEGTCQPDSSGGMECVCTSGFTGDLCETVVVGGVGDPDCEDGPNVEETLPGNYYKRSCVNRVTVTSYNCHGKCPPGQTCVGIPNGDEVISMKHFKTGRRCPNFINPIIEECECVDQVPSPPVVRPGRSPSCKLVPSNWAKGSFRRTFGGKKCVNINRFRRHYCSGSCPNAGQKCTGTYVNEIIILDCEGTRATRAEMRAIACECK